MPYEDETYDDEQPEPGHLDEEEELGAAPRRPLDEEEPEELEIDRPAYAPPPPAAPARPAPRKKVKARPKRKKKASKKKARKAHQGRTRGKKSKKRFAKKSRRGSKRR
jgi:hypothetical protein